MLLLTDVILHICVVYVRFASISLHQRSKTTNKVPMATRKHDFDSCFTREILKNHNFRRKLSAYQKTTFWIIEKLGNRYELRWHFVKIAPYLKRNINVPNVELITVLSIVFKIHERNKEELDKYCKNWNWKILVKLKPPTKKNSSNRRDKIKQHMKIWHYQTKFGWRFSLI